MEILTMKKIIFLFAAALCLGGCCCMNRDSAVEDAKKLIRENRAECIVVRNGNIAALERGRGVSPLLKIYDTRPDVMKGAVVVDKVIGRAAAFVIIKGKASAVYGKITSEDAVKLLSEHKIPVTYDLLVPRILNQKRNGLCPLEDSVKGIDDADAALESMRKRISELRRRK